MYILVCEQLEDKWEVVGVQEQLGQEFVFENIYESGSSELPLSVIGGCTLT